jgi:peptidoglycan hydrolase-like protein with peptidoglycan-binding domain
MADGGSAVPSSTRLRRIEHPLRAVVAALVLLGSITASFLTGLLVQAPDRGPGEQAQQTIRVTAPVERRVVDSRTAFAGSVVAGSEQALSTIPSGVPAVVTRRTVDVGDVVRPGSLVGAVSGRPVFALPAPLALYRDLRTEDEGDDVSSLQRALRETGADVEVTGWVDWRTTAAVTELFVDNGFPAPTAAAPETVEPSPTDPDPSEPASSPTPEVQQPHVVRPPGPLIPSASFVALAAAEATVTGALPLGATVTAEAPLVRVRTSPNTVSFRADAVSAATLTDGQEVSIQADTRQLAGTITAVGEFVEASDGKAPGRDVTVVSADPAFAGLSPGLSVTVLPEAEHEESLAVPTVALRQDAEGTFVLVPDDGEADAGAEQPEPRRVPVTVDYSGNGWTAIAGDVLPPGSEVILQ